MIDMNNPNKYPQKTSKKEFLLNFIGEFFIQTLAMLFFTSSIGLFVWIGFWSLLLIFPIAFCVYYFLFKSE